MGTEAFPGGGRRNSCEHPADALASRGPLCVQVRESPRPSYSPRCQHPLHHEGTIRPQLAGVRAGAPNTHSRRACSPNHLQPRGRRAGISELARQAGRPSLTNPPTGAPTNDERRASERQAAAEPRRATPLRAGAPVTNAQCVTRTLGLSAPPNPSLQRTTFAPRSARGSGSR